MSFDPIHHHDRAFEELQEAYNKLKIDYDNLRRENIRLRSELSWVGEREIERSLDAARRRANDGNYQ